MTTPGYRQRSEELLAEYRKDPTDTRRNAIVELHLPLLKRLCLHYAEKYRSKDPNLTVDDLLGMASMAAMRAVKTFDPERGTVFTTYLGKAVARELMRTAMSDRVGGKTSHRYNLTRSNKMLRNASQELGREATVADLGELDTAETRVVESADFLRRLSSARGVYPEDLLRYTGPEQEAIQGEQSAILAECLNRLGERSRKLIEWKLIDCLPWEEIQDRLKPEEISRVLLLYQLQGALDELRVIVRTDGRLGES